MSNITEQQLTDFQAVITFLKGAPEIPFDAAVAERLAPFAVASGFVASTGEFVQRVRDYPISTLLEWLLYSGQIIYSLETP